MDNKQRIVNLTVQIKDKEGKTHVITLSCITQKVWFSNDQKYVFQSGIGVSICNPLDADKFNADLGITIATGRALKKPILKLYAEQSIMFSKYDANKKLEQLAILAEQDINNFIERFMRNGSKKDTK